MTSSAVLFDLDGTLVDTPTLILQSFESVCRKSGLEIDRTFARSLIGKPLDLIFPLLLPDADDVCLQKAVAAFRAEFAALSLPRARALVFPGVDGLLRALRAAGTPLAIVTSKITASAHELLGASGLSAHFLTVVGHDLAPAGKPAPHLAWLAANLLDVSVCETIVVGDSVDDVGMARAAGMIPIGVAWGVSSAAALHEAGAVEVVDDVSALARTIHRRLNHQVAIS